MSSPEMLSEVINSGEVARLFSVVSEKSKEKRAVSVFLACLKAIPDLNRNLMATIGRKVGSTSKISTFSEIELVNNSEPTFPRWLPNSAPMVAKQAPFWNHERHFHSLDRTFDDRMTFCTLFRLDYSSFGHTSPVIISAFHRSACRNGRWSQFIDQP